jgi:hypothetical protein
VPPFYRVSNSFSGQKTAAKPELNRRILVRRGRLVSIQGIDPTLNCPQWEQNLPSIPYNPVEEMSYSSTSAFPLYRNVQHCALSFTYRGPFMDDFTSRIVDISENTIADTQGLPKMNKKVSFLLVECFQNIIRHGETVEEEKEQPANGGLFNFKNIGDSYIINSINPVRNGEIDSLKSQVELINSLDSVELKQMYKKHLFENEISDKGGAGLGLIEMARRSGQKLRYEFEQKDDAISHFHQQVMINRNGAEVVAPNFINQTKELFTLMGERQALIEYKGDFSQKSIVPLLTIVEKNFGRDLLGRNLGRRVGHILIEILQNISKHAVEHDGIRDGLFIIGEESAGIFILAGNIVDDAETINS